MNADASYARDARDARGTSDETRMLITYFQIHFY